MHSLKGRENLYADQTNPAGFRARETYTILGPDEFKEVFEIAAPGKDFEVYSEGHFKRKK